MLAAASAAVLMLMAHGCAPTTTSEAARNAPPDSPPSTAPDTETAAMTDTRSDAADPLTTERAEAVFAGGCFWCVEAVFEELDGVIEAVSGYAGGSAETADYRLVSSGTTGHAEAVKIIYDPATIDYVTLLSVHFATHDPTQLNRQGNDIGPQYRSAIFYANEREKELAEAMIADLTDAGAFDRPIVTTLEPLEAFYEAEHYHQNYACLNPNQPYIRAVSLPKVDKVREKFPDLLKDVSPLEQPPGR